MVNSLTLEQLEQLLPLACEWAEAQEELILRDGVPLTPPRIEDARRIGVSHPGSVRLLEVSRVPVPEKPALLAAVRATQLISADTLGLTLRYGIYIRSDGWGGRSLVVHELVHTLQYERLGGFRNFLARYLRECVTVGYPEAPLEQEAIRMAGEICGSGGGSP